MLKTSKLTPVAKVWRGFKGASLPKSFFAPNDDGVRGGIEFGFSSTTTDRAQAVSYAAGSASTILEMQQGMCDRGADLAWLSQYPHEAEVLFPPLTGLEAVSTQVDGSSLLINTRLSLNMASLTLEQVISRRRKLLMDMAEGMKAEIKHDLSSEPREAETGSRILGKALEWGVLSSHPDWFNEDENFAKAVESCLGVKQGVVHSVGKLSLELKDVVLSDWPPVPGRALLLAGWMRCEPAATSIDLRGACLTAEEAYALAASVSACPRLTSLNVLRNETMGDKGAATLAAALSTSGGALRSLCGVTAQNTTLEVARKGLAPIDAQLVAADLQSCVWSESIGAEQSAGASSKKGGGKVGAGGGVAKLMRRGAGTSGWYPLIWAAKDGNNALVATFLANGCPVNTHEEEKSMAGYTPLMWAAYRGHTYMHTYIRTYVRTYMHAHLSHILKMSLLETSFLTTSVSFAYALSNVAGARWPETSISQACESVRWRHD